MVEPIDQEGSPKRSRTEMEMEQDNVVQMMNLALMMILTVQLLI